MENVDLTKVQAKSTGGAIKRRLGGPIGWMRAQAGRFFPGYGGGDRIPILGEAGEYMLNKESVREGGLDAAHAFNTKNWGALVGIISEKLRLGGPIQPAWPALALSGGGSVSSSPSSSPMSSREVARNYYVPGESDPIRVKATEREAQRLMNALERRHRRTI